MTLVHYTLTTGHLRTSPRGEVAESIIRLLDPLVTKGGGWVPGGDGRTAIGFNITPANAFTDQAAQDWVGIEITVRSSPAGAACSPVIVGAVPWSEEAAEAAWHAMRRMAQKDGMPADTHMPSGIPLLSVMLTPAAVFVDPELLATVADFERCLAWTILAREGLAS